MHSEDAVFLYHFNDNGAVQYDTIDRTKKFHGVCKLFNYSDFIRINRISMVSYVNGFAEIYGKHFPKTVMIDGYRLDGRITDDSHLFLKLSDLTKFNETILNQFNGRLTDTYGNTCFFICNGLKREVFSYSYEEDIPVIEYTNGVIKIKEKPDSETYSYADAKSIVPEMFPADGVSIENLDDRIRKQSMLFRINRRTHIMSVPCPLSDYPLPHMNYSESELKKIPTDANTPVPEYFIDNQGLCFFDNADNTILIYEDDCFKTIKNNDFSWDYLKGEDYLTVISIHSDNGKIISKSTELQIQLRKWATNRIIKREDAINMNICDIKAPEQTIVKNRLIIDTDECFIYTTADYEDDLHAYDSKDTNEIGEHFFFSSCIIDFRKNARSDFSSISRSAVPEPTIQKNDDLILISTGSKLAKLRYSIGNSTTETEKRTVLIKDNNSIHKIQASCFVTCPDGKRIESSSVSIVKDMSFRQFKIDTYSLIRVKCQTDDLPCGKTDFIKAFLPVVAGKKAIQVPIFIVENEFYMLESDFKDIEEKTSIILNQFELPDGKIIAHEITKKEKSELYEMGYNVAKVNNLSESERQAILCRAVDVKLYGENTAKRIIDFIEWLISIHPQHDYAISKWKTDIEYLKKTFPQYAKIKYGK